MVSIERAENRADGAVVFHRTDGVHFVYMTHSPNGTRIDHMTAHNDFWASVPVGHYQSATEARQAAESFAMPGNQWSGSKWVWVGPGAEDWVREPA